MRSLTSCQAADMDRLFWLSVLLTHLPVIESMKKTESCLSQPDKVIWQKIGQAAVLPCTISKHCSVTDFHYEWFAFREDAHLRLNLDSRKYILNGASLHIKSLNASDSGIYHCAAASLQVSACCQHHVGLGTTLVVTGILKEPTKYILLRSSFVLLAIYSLVTATLIILKKYGCNMSVCRKMYKPDKNNGNKKTEFRDVLQEMHSRGNFEKSKQTASRNRSHVEAASSDFNSSTDGIYQNV